MLIEKIIALKRFLKWTFAKNPLLFYSIYGLIHGLRSKSYPKFVNRDTKIVIEGFQRSANTFAARALQYAQPTQIDIAYHVHTPAQIIRAVKWEIPTLVLIRNPKDAVSSFVAHWPRVSVSQTLKIYIDFYRSIRNYKSGYVIGQFEEVTQNYSIIIQRVNAKFGTDFLVPFVDKIQKDKFLEEWNSRPRGSFKNNQSGSRKKAIIIQEINQKKYKKLLTEAEAIYQEFTSS